MDLRPGSLRSGPLRGGPRGASAYLSPNSPFATDWEPRGAASIQVTSPADVFRRRDAREDDATGGDPTSGHGRPAPPWTEPAAGAPAQAVDAPARAAPVLGVDPDEHRRVRERVAFLEGALEASVRVESAAQTFSDRLEDRARSERKQYERDLSSLRLQLEQRERDLRTLALEMGKVQGRLEVAEARLLAASTERTTDDRDPYGSAGDRGLPRRTGAHRERSFLARLREAFRG